MFEAKSMLFLCVETPLHAGTGRSLGTVDLPIQRERATGYPLVQASSVKGRLRAETKDMLDKDDWLTIFGPEQDSKEEGKQSSDFGGALSTGDARILLFPVRSLSGVFAWVTCVDVLARFQREALGIGLKLDDGDKSKFVLPKEPGENGAQIVNKNLLADDNNIVLEEFSFKAQVDPGLESLAKWLANHVLPQELTEYQYWRDNLASKLCILPENAFRDFVLYGTEVQTHIALDQQTKVVKEGALWTSESLPVDSILYAPVQSTPPRNPKRPVSVDEASKILKAVIDLVEKKDSASQKTKLARIHLGGDETTGQGVVALKFVGGE